MKHFNFAQIHLGKTGGEATFQDQTFVGTIFCERNDQGFTTDWWVTGVIPQSHPALVVRLETSIPVEKENLLKKLESIWNKSVKTIALSSSNSGGLEVSTEEFKLLTRDQQHYLIHTHLFAHDRSEHFSTLGFSKVAKTASMYKMLTSLGTKQQQKAIAEFEDPEKLGQVKTTAINQRLAIAKQAGYL
jgi:hypothetical protein